MLTWHTLTTAWLLAPLRTRQLWYLGPHITRTRQNILRWVLSLGIRDGPSMEEPDNQQATVGTRNHTKCVDAWKLEDSHTFLFTFQQICSWNISIFPQKNFFFFALKLLSKNSYHTTRIQSSMSRSQKENWVKKVWINYILELSGQKKTQQTLRSSFQDTWGKVQFRVERVRIKHDPPVLIFIWSLIYIHLLTKTSGLTLIKVLESPMSDEETETTIRNAFGFSFLFLQICRSFQQKIVVLYMETIRFENQDWRVLIFPSSRYSGVTVINPVFLSRSGDIVSGSETNSCSNWMCLAFVLFSKL